MYSYYTLCMTLQFGTTFEIRWCHFCSFLVVQDHRYFNTFLLISTSGHISLFPLLFQPAGVYLHRCVYCLGVWVVCCIDVWVCLCKCVYVGMFFISVFLQRLQSRCACSVPILWWHLSSSKTGMVRWEWVGVMYPGTLELYKIKTPALVWFWSVWVCLWWSILCFSSVAGARSLGRLMDLSCHPSSPSMLWCFYLSKCTAYSSMVYKVSWSITSFSPCSWLLSPALWASSGPGSYVTMTSSPMRELSNALSKATDVIYLMRGRARCFYFILILFHWTSMDYWEQQYIFLLYMYIEHTVPTIC